jgi:hypothetical protein
MTSMCYSKFGEVPGRVVCAPAQQGNIEYIRAYSGIFEVFLKNIQRICPIRPVRAWHNGQARPPVSLRTPSMTTLVLGSGICLMRSRRKNFGDQVKAVVHNWTSKWIPARCSMTLFNSQMTLLMWKTE